MQTVAWLEHDLKKPGNYRGGGNSNIGVIFHPYSTWRNGPVWTHISLTVGWFNHQLLVDGLPMVCLANSKLAHLLSFFFNSMLHSTVDFDTAMLNRKYTLWKRLMCCSIQLKEIHGQSMEHESSNWTMFYGHPSTWSIHKKNTQSTSNSNNHFIQDSCALFCCLFLLIWSDWKFSLSKSDPLATTVFALSFFFLKGGWGSIKLLTHDSRLQANDRVAWESGMASPEVCGKKLATLDDHIIPRGVGGKWYVLMVQHSS